jgi:hypothetical protein
MKFSKFQWLAIIVFDLLLRCSFMFLTSLNPLNVIFALCLSLVHLTILVLVNYSVEPFELGVRATAAATLITTNVAFVASIVLTSIALSASGRTTHCYTYQYRYECYWVDGSMTWIGVRSMALAMAIQVFVNTIPFLVCTYRLHWAGNERAARR